MTCKNVNYHYMFNSYHTIMKLSLKYFLPGLLLVTFGLLLNVNESNAQIQDQQEQTQGENVVDVVKSQEDNTKFAELLEETDMPKVLAQEGPFTVVVPSDEALESLDADIAELKKDPQQVQNLVSGHLYQGNLPAEDVESALGVKVINGNQEASNGVVHVIDEVIQR